MTGVNNKYRGDEDEIREGYDQWIQYSAKQRKKKLPGIIMIILPFFILAAYVFFIAGKREVPAPLPAAGIVLAAGLLAGGVLLNNKRIREHNAALARFREYQCRMNTMLQTEVFGVPVKTGADDVKAPESVMPGMADRLAGNSEWRDWSWTLSLCSEFVYRDSVIRFCGYRALSRRDGPDSSRQELIQGSFLMIDVKRRYSVPHELHILARKKEDFSQPDPLARTYAGSREYPDSAACIPRPVADAVMGIRDDFRRSIISQAWITKFGTFYFDMNGWGPETVSNESYEETRDILRDMYQYLRKLTDACIDMVQTQEDPE